MASSAPIRPGDYVPTADERIVLYGLDWKGFQTLLELRGDRRWRIAYLDGAVELMAPSQGHEITNGFLGHLVEHYCLHLDILICPTGSWLIKKKKQEAGAEPDKTYCFGTDARTRKRPDLVIEVQWTRGGLEKLEIYRRLEAIVVHVLTPAGYVVRPRSEWLPDIDLALLCRLCKSDTLNDAVRGLRDTFPKR